MIIDVILTTVWLLLFFLATVQGLPTPTGVHTGPEDRPGTLANCTQYSPKWTSSSPKVEGGTATGLRRVLLEHSEGLLSTAALADLSPA